MYTGSLGGPAYVVSAESSHKINLCRLDVYMSGKEEASGLEINPASQKYFPTLRNPWLMK